MGKSESFERHEGLVGLFVSFLFCCKNTTSDFFFFTVQFYAFLGFSLIDRLGRATLQDDQGSEAELD